LKTATAASDAGTELRSSGRRAACHGEGSGQKIGACAEACVDKQQRAGMSWGGAFAAIFWVLISLAFSYYVARFGGYNRHEAEHPREWLL
jgi:hypothetical protein